VLAHRVKGVQLGHFRSLSLVNPAH